MPNKIPEDQHHLYDGYDGSTPNNRVDMDALLAAAPQEIKDRIKAREEEVKKMIEQKIDTKE